MFPQWEWDLTSVILCAYTCFIAGLIMFLLPRGRGDLSTREPPQQDPIVHANNVISHADNVNFIQRAESSESEPENCTLNSLDRLSKILRDRAMKIVGEVPMPGNIESVSPVNQRLAPVNKSSQSEVGLTEIFQLAKSEAEKQASYTNHNDTARAYFVAKNKNNVLLIGQPGIGKTTLSKKFLSYVAVEKVVLTEVKYPFYIRLGNVDPNENTTVLDFIFKHGLPRECTVDKKVIKDFKRDISSGSKVLLVLDGVDELQGELSSTSSSQAGMPVMRILGNLMSGEVGSNWYKLWTARTSKAFEINPKMKPKTCINILGLDDQNKDALCRLVCKEKCGEVLQYLKSHPKLYSACHVPIICILACISIVDSITRSVKMDKNSSITAVMLDICDQYSRTEHTRQDKPKNSLTILGKLAHHGLKMGIQEFESTHFNHLKVNESVIEGYTHSTLAEGTNFRFKILEGDKRITFFHQMIQEFFAALHIVLSFKEFEFENTFLAAAFEIKWEEVALFVFGLQNEETWKKHQSLLGERGNRRKKQLDGIKRLMIKNGQEFSKRATEGQWNHQKKLKFLQIISWISEANNKEINAAVIENFPPSVFLQYIHFNLTSITSLGYFIKIMPKGKLLRLLLSRCALDHECIAILKKVITSGVQLEELDLSENTIENEGLKELLPCLPHISKKLSLSDCRISGQGIYLLAEFMYEKNVKLEELDVSKNDLRKSVKDLSRMSKQIKYKMRMYNSRIKPADKEKLCKETRDRHKEFLDFDRIQDPAREEQLT